MKIIEKCTDNTDAGELVGAVHEDPQRLGLLDGLGVAVALKERLNSLQNLKSREL